METFIYDGKNSQKALEINLKGGHVLCPRCKAELTIINSLEFNGLLEIYCPVNPKHISTSVTTTKHFEEFNRFFS